MAFDADRTPNERAERIRAHARELLESSQAALDRSDPATRASLLPAWLVEREARQDREQRQAEAASDGERVNFFADLAKRAARYLEKTAGELRAQIAADRAAQTDDLDALRRAVDALEQRIAELEGRR